MDMVRIADDEGDRHRLAERAPKPEQDSAEHADPCIGEHDPPHHFAGRRAERVGALAQYGRHRFEHVAHYRGDEGQHHDGQDKSGGQHADAERWPFDQKPDPRNGAECVDQGRLDMLLHKRRQHEEAPNAVDDAGDRRQ